MIGNLVAWCVFGLIVGAVSRLLVPGRDALGCLGTIALGIVGSFVGGFLFMLLFRFPHDEFQPAAFLGSVIGGIIVLLVWRRMNPRPPLS